MPADGADYVTGFLLVHFLVGSLRPAVHRVSEGEKSKINEAMNNIKEENLFVQLLIWFLSTSTFVETTESKAILELFN